MKVCNKENPKSKIFKHQLIDRGQQKNGNHS